MRRTDLNGSDKDKQTSLIQLHARLGDALDDDTMLGELLAECLSRRVGNARDHQVKTSLCHSDSAHAMMNTSRTCVMRIHCQYALVVSALSKATRDRRTETALNDLETLAKVQDDVLGGDADVIVADLHVSFRSIVAAHDLAWPDYRYAGCVGRHDDEGLPLVWIFVGRIAIICCPCLAQVQAVLSRHG